MRDMVDPFLPRTRSELGCPILLATFLSHPVEEWGLLGLLSSCCGSAGDFRGLPEDTAG